ncbi:hypothetical protein A7P95_10900 [Eikenella longinqua]|uniref:Uncharacterized protein n=1 Tax=Eikenella longinqua TaxID=1795827 RepID=A0A1A9RUH8_9NEIS|nr:hypothetical protein [Eikenella longinqua]OAM25903.1 hypothetical protein A7P95_10900 [Eikenella longinqua]
MLLKMFDVLVLRGMETEIPATVPRHEAELLAMIHGSDAVKLRSEAPAGVLEFADVRDERERLRLKYGLKTEDAYWADVLYPSDLSLGEAMQRGAADTEQPEAPKPNKRKRAAAEQPEAPEGGDEAAV